MSDDATRYAAVEAGGTKFRAAVLDGDMEILDEVRVATADDPDVTIGKTVAFFEGYEGSVSGLGIANFGPVDLRRDRDSYGSVMETPKPGWSGVDVLGRMREALGVPTVIDTDVGAAALAEGTLGAGSGRDVIVYVTVGTGIGAAALIAGAVHHGHGHSEMGHIPTARRPGDKFPGSCPFHGDCMEGMASGAAVEKRSERAAEDPADRFEAAYLAQLVRALTYILAPDRIVFGGGLFQNPDLLPALHEEARRELGGYSTNPELVADVASYVVKAHYGQDAGLIGAGLLGKRAAEQGS